MKDQDIERAKRDELSRIPLIRPLMRLSESPLFNLIVYWVLETCAFTLLPLIVYIIIFFALAIDWYELLKLPEWMFVAIVVYSETTRKLVLYYRDYEGFSSKAVRAVSLGVIGMVTSSVFLAFSAVAQLRDAITLSTIYYAIQTILFVASLMFSAMFGLWMGWRTGEGELLASMRLEGSHKEKPARE
jgi:hypothetical protein